LSVVTKCPFVLGVVFWKNQNSSAFKKYSNFCLACAKGESVAIERKRGFPDPMGATFPPILGNSPVFHGNPDPLGHGFKAPKNSPETMKRPIKPNGSRVQSLTHWVRGCRGLPCPLGARVLGVAHWVRVAVVPGESGSEGEGVGPAGSMVRLRRHRRNSENFLENQKPSGFTYSIAPRPHKPPQP
jgi:hypothetical protein